MNKLGLAAAGQCCRALARANERTIYRMINGLVERLSVKLRNGVARAFPSAAGQEASRRADEGPFVETIETRDSSKRSKNASASVAAGVLPIASALIIRARE